MARVLALLGVLVVLVAPMAVTATTMGNDLEKARDSISNFYRSHLALAGNMYEDPTVMIIEEDSEPVFLEGCGSAGPGAVGFYCRGIYTIVVERRPSLIPEIIPDEQVMQVVLAHEWGHYIQDRYLGMHRVEGGVLARDTGTDTVYPIEFELMADCLAGSWIAYEDASSDLGFDIQDVGDALLAQSRVGGPADRSLGSHGTGAQRVAALLSGYDYGILGCMTIDPLDE